MVCFWFSERSYLKIIKTQRATEKDIWNLALASTGILIHIYATHSYTRSHMERGERERETERTINYIVEKLHFPEILSISKSSEPHDCQHAIYLKMF